MGRGALAGPVVAGACLFRIMNQESGIMGKKVDDSKRKEKLQRSKAQRCKEILKLGIDDSKRLKARERERLAKEIIKYFHIGIGEASVAEINELGIVSATERAMKRAVNRIMKCELRIMEDKVHDSLFIIPNSTTILVDGPHKIPRLSGFGLDRQEAIIKGDQKSISIAAASIVAKVYRDKLMRKLDRENGKKYKWGLNKGYGTSKHWSMISLYGSSFLHRVKFID